MAKRQPEQPPTPKMVRLHHQLVQQWGEPTDIFVFDGRELDHTVNVQLLHVPTWAADKHCEVTALNTLGMSEQKIPRARYSAELHLAYRGALRKKQRHD